MDGENKRGEDRQPYGEGDFGLGGQQSSSEFRGREDQHFGGGGDYGRQPWRGDQDEARGQRSGEGAYDQTPGDGYGSEYGGYGGAGQSSPSYRGPSDGGPAQGGYGHGAYGPGPSDPSAYNQGSYGQGGYERSRYGRHDGGYGQDDQGAYGGERGSNREYRPGGQPGHDRNWWDKTRDEVGSWFGDDDAQRRRRIDGMHRGRGPKGYRRSDERIGEDINDRLTDDPFVDASNIEVAVKDGEVTLSGTVSDRGDKRRAEDLAENCSGVHNVQNNLRVQSSASTGAPRA